MRNRRRVAPFTTAIVEDQQAHAHDSGFLLT
jgi:hypothetical protein